MSNSLNKFSQFSNIYILMEDDMAPKKKYNMCLSVNLNLNPSIYCTFQKK